MSSGSENHRDRQSGQAAVEAAMVMPLMVFLTLGIIQLTMIQHAKLMTEYAAYQAARAGIVWNGSNERMRDAATIALAPTMGRTDSFAELGSTWARHQANDALLSQLPWGSAVPADVNGSGLRGYVRVDTVNPAQFSSIDSIWKLREGSNWKELDFDGPDAYPEIPSLQQKIGKFFNLTQPDPDEETYRKSTVLMIRLRYWYEMRVPFANWVVFVSWFASNANVALYGSIDRSTLTPGNMMNRTTTLDPLGGMGQGMASDKGYDALYAQEMVVLWALATGRVPMVGRRFLLPLTATHSMRMQSNFHRKWIMHRNPSWGL